MRAFAHALQAVSFIMDRCVSQDAEYDVVSVLREIGFMVQVWPHVGAVRRLQL